jgi:hypothetical protein
MIILVSAQMLMLTVNAARSNRKINSTTARVVFPLSTVTVPLNAMLLHGKWEEDDLSLPAPLSFENSLLL